MGRVIDFIKIVSVLLPVLVTVAGESMFHKHYFPEDPELYRAAKLKSNLNIEMSVRELAFLYHGINNSRGYLEFGSGSTTVMACLLLKDDARKKFYVIDSESHYQFLRMSDNKCIDHAVTTAAGIVKLVDIGAVDSTGFPTNKKYEKNWHRYITTVGLLKSETIDVIFLDGRFRVAAIVSSFLYFPAASVYLHDYRRYEATIGDIAVWAQHCDGLFRLTRKPEVPDAYLKKKLSTYMNNPN